MSDTPRLSRRGFVAAGGASLAALAIEHRDGAASAALETTSAATPPSTAPATFETLTATEAREFEAIAARILPSAPGSPGARELGVVAFADRQLGARMAASLTPLRDGLAELARVVGERHPGTTSFSALTTTQQDAILADFQKTDASKVKNSRVRTRLAARAQLFNVCWFLTASGAFSDPRYGGNRGKGGWRLLGFEDRFSWAPPFGAADRA